MSSNKQFKLHRFLYRLTFSPLAYMNDKTIKAKVTDVEWPEHAHVISHYVLPGAGDTMVCATCVTTLRGYAPPSTMLRHIRSKQHSNGMA